MDNGKEENGTKYYPINKIQKLRLETWKQIVWMREHLPQAVVIGSKEMILVLLHNLTYEVAIVVKHDRQDGYASHR